jgi:hypothetical protein
LVDVQVTEEIRRKGHELLRCFDQPVQHRIGLDLKDSGGGPNAESLGQAGQHVHDPLHLGLFAIKNGAVMFRKKAIAAEAVKLPPGSAIRMAIGSQVVQP